MVGCCFKLAGNKDGNSGGCSTSEVLAGWVKKACCCCRPCWPEVWLASFFILMLVTAAAAEVVEDEVDGDADRKPPNRPRLSSLRSLR